MVTCRTDSFNLWCILLCFGEFSIGRDKPFEYIWTNYIWKQNDNKMMRAIHIKKKRETSAGCVSLSASIYTNTASTSASALTSLFNRVTSEICCVGYNSLSRLIILLHSLWPCCLWWYSMSHFVFEYRNKREINVKICDFINAVYSFALHTV